jgi:hypothetical protein
MTMKKLLCILLLAPCSLLPAGERDRGDTAIRDANNKIVGYIQHTATGTVIRDANGKILASVPPKSPEKK